jgi:hypothetical protein
VQGVDPFELAGVDGLMDRALVVSVQRQIGLRLLLPPVNV